MNQFTLRRRQLGRYLAALTLLGVLSGFIAVDGGGYDVFVHWGPAVGTLQPPLQNIIGILSAIGAWQVMQKSPSSPLVSRWPRLFIAMNTGSSDAYACIEPDHCS